MPEYCCSIGCDSSYCGVDLVDQLGYNLTCDCTVNGSVTVSDIYAIASPDGCSPLTEGSCSWAPSVQAQCIAQGSCGAGGCQAGVVAGSSSPPPTAPPPASPPSSCALALEANRCEEWCSNVHCCNEGTDWSQNILDSCGGCSFCALDGDGLVSKQCEKWCSKSTCLPADDEYSFRCSGCEFCSACSDLTDEKKEKKCKKIAFGGKCSKTGKRNKCKWSCCHYAGMI